MLLLFPSFPIAIHARPSLFRHRAVMDKQRVTHQTLAPSRWKVVELS